MKRRKKHKKNLFDYNKEELKGVRVGCGGTWVRTYQMERTACGKALEWKCACPVHVAPLPIRLHP